MSNETLTNNETMNETTNDAPNTFTLAQFARDLGLNPKIVRARFRRYHANDDARFDVVRDTCERAKSRWVYRWELRDAIRDIIVRDDDE